MPRGHARSFRPALTAPVPVRVHAPVPVREAEEPDVPPRIFTELILNLGILPNMTGERVRKRKQTVCLENGWIGRQKWRTECDE